MKQQHIALLSVVLASIFGGSGCRQADSHVSQPGELQNSQTTAEHELTIDPVPYQSVVACDQELTVVIDEVSFVGHCVVDQAPTNTSGGAPFDTDIAVAGDLVLSVVNVELAAFSTDGTLLGRVPLLGLNSPTQQGFWDSLCAYGTAPCSVGCDPNDPNCGGGDFFASTDPRILYDSLHNRFWITGIQKSSEGARLLIAVSDDVGPAFDPLDTNQWSHYYVVVDSAVDGAFDQPKLGVDSTTLYVSGWLFNTGSDRPIVFAADLAPLLAGNMPNSDGSPPTTTWILDVPDTSTAPTPVPTIDLGGRQMWFIHHRPSLNNTELSLWRLMWDSALAQWNWIRTSVSVTEFTSPPDIIQSNGVAIDVQDARFLSTQCIEGTIYATHHVSDPTSVDRAVARWYEIDVSGFVPPGPFGNGGVPPVLNQSGTVDPDAWMTTSGNSAIFPAIAVDRFGSIALTYTLVSDVVEPQMMTALHHWSDTTGSTRPQILRRAGTFPSESMRWGDYHSIEVDPMNGEWFWAHGMYAPATGVSFGRNAQTWIVGFDPCKPADINCDGNINYDDLSFLLGCWGQILPGCEPADLVDTGMSTGVVDHDDLSYLLGQWTG
ncbi:MAG: hypothetical protein AAF432_10595 [Planctomycetota bacterium]